MIRNAESHFSEIPSVDVTRSIFDRSHTHKTSFNVGEVIPFYVDEVLPGDTFNITTSKVVRLQTLLTPIMDNLYLDTYYFFIPNRLVWTHWKEFMGENNSSPWVQTTAYQVPRIASPASTGFIKGTLADYMGLPTGVVWNASAANAPMALPFRAYAKVIDDWFRNQNVQYPLNIPLGDANQQGVNTGNLINDIANGGLPFVACKYFDAFTSALPSPQKANAPVGVPVNVLSSSVPVRTGSLHSGQARGIVWQKTNGDNFNQAQGYLAYNRDTNVQSQATMFPGTASSFPTSYALEPVNLWADLASAVGSFSINELRLAFQLQKFYERCARGGTRYIELLKAHFGVTSPDARLQRSEYLGGNRIPLNVHEVTNSAQTTNDYLGDVGAKSATSDIHSDFEKSFTEHGFVIGVCVVRYNHSYAQGIEKFWLRKDTTDYYFPVFANIGEVPIETCEICATAANMSTKTTFGYQEAWYDYRYKTDRITAEMRPGAVNSLASWHLADNYSSAPTLSASWMQEDKSNVNRVLAVDSSVADQIFADFYIQNTCTRCMPMYSIPGLIDHN